MTDPTTTTPDAPGTDRRAATAAVIGLLVGPAAAAAGWAAVRAAGASLPDRLAVHWGADGAPDRFASVAGATTQAVLLTALMPLAAAGLGLLVHRSTRHLAAALATGLAVCLTATTFGTLLLQRDGRAPGDPGPLVVAGIVASVLAALVVGRLLRPDAPAVPPTRAALPQGAAVLDVPATSRLAWTGSAGAQPAALGIIGGAVVLVAWLAARTSPWLWALVLGLAALALLTVQATVVVDAAGVTVRSLRLVTWFRVPLERVVSAEVAQVRAVAEFGGWGWRLGRDGRRAFVSRSGSALVVHRVGEPDVLVTVDGAHEAAAVLNTLVARQS